MSAAEVLEGPRFDLDLVAVARRLADLEGNRRQEAINAILQVAHRVADKMLFAAENAFWESEDREGRVLVSFSADARCISILEIVFDDMFTLDSLGRFVLNRNGRRYTYPVPGAGPFGCFDAFVGTIINDGVRPHWASDTAKLAFAAAIERARKPQAINVSRAQAIVVRPTLAAMIAAASKPTHRSSSAKSAAVHGKYALTHAAGDGLCPPVIRGRSIRTLNDMGEHPLV